MGFWEFLAAYWWLLLIFGGGILDVLAGFLSGTGMFFAKLGENRNKKKKLRAEIKVLERENEHLKSLLQTSIGAASGGRDGTQVAELAGQAKRALEDRTMLLTLLAQVRATDRAYPQLPEELSTQISETLDRMLPSGIRVDTESAERKALRMPRRA